MNTTRDLIYFFALASVLGGVFPLMVASQIRGNITFYTPNTLSNDSFSVIARIKIVNGSSCSALTPDYAGTIWIFSEYNNFCNTEGYNPVGLIIPGSSNPDRAPGYHYIYHGLVPIEPPFAEISLPDIFALQELMRAEPDLIGVFASGDPNDWRYMNRSILCMILFAICIASALTAAVLSLTKLAKILKAQGSHFSVAQISLGLVSLGSIDLAAVVVYLIIRNQVEIIGLLEIFVLFLVFADACQTLACLAICVFWYDIMTDIRGGTKKRISKRIAILLIIAASIIVLLLLLLPFNLLFEASQVVKILVPVGYFIIAMAISISWLILGIKLLKSLKNKAAVSESKRKLTKKLSNKIFITTAMFFATRVLEVAWTICELVYSPLSAILTLSLALVFNVATNAVLAQVFNVPKNSDKEPTDDVKLTALNDANMQLYNINIAL